MKKIMVWILGLALLAGCDTDPNTYAEIETEMGVIRVKLYEDTPRHRDNFVKLAEEGYYDGLLFHRVMSQFMIQGGDPDSRDAAPGRMLGQGGPGYTLAPEFGHRHFRGVLAAARQPDAVNPERESSGSQFYLVQGQPVDENMLSQLESRRDITYTPEERQRYLQSGGTPWLDGEYTVFGEVVEGMEVVDRIAGVQTNRQARPLQDVKMEVRIVN